MRRVFFLPIIFFLVVGAYALTALLQAPGRIVPITGITHFIDGLILFIVGLFLFARTRGKFFTAPTFFYFTLFFILIGIFQIIMGLPHALLFGQKELFSNSMSWAFMEGHIFLYASLAFFVMIPTKIFVPKLKWVPFWAIAFFGAWITLVNILNPAAPFFDNGTGITLLNVHPKVGMLIPIIAIASWVPASIMFAVQAFRSNDQLIKRRGLLLAIGLLTITFAGPLHDIAKSGIQFLTADILTMAGFLITVAGVLTEFKHEENKQNLN